MKQPMFNRIGFACLLLACASSQAQTGYQRIGGNAPQAQVTPAATPTFNAQPGQASTGQAAMAVPGSPMPTPMPTPKLDLVREATDMIAPLTPQEVLRLRKEMKARAEAANQPISPLAKPVIRVARVDIGPGAVPELIRVTLTEGATVSFMDAGGRPWKVDGADNFNPTGLDIGRAGEHGIVISAKAAETSGNISVRLVGLPSPIPLKVMAGPGVRDVDYAVDMQVPRFLPGAPAPLGAVASQLSLGIDDLINYLLKTPPKEARPLTLDGLPGGMAWQVPSGRVILRTNQMVASPNYSRRQSSFDGMTVYDLPATPYVLVSMDGRLAHVRVNGLSVQ